MGLFTRYAMDALMKTSHPEVIRRQCWNLHPHRTPCTACKDICPYGDAIFTRPNLVKDWDPCTDCGLCVSACRSGCIVPSPEQVQRDTSLADTDNDTLWLGCEKSTRKNTAVRACVASFSWETLAYLALNKKLVLDLTPCGECENDVCAAQLRKELTRLVEFLGPQLFESRVTLAYEQDEAPYHVQELSRREMFSHMTEGSRAGTKKLLQMLPGLRSEEDSAADFRLMLHQRTKQLKAASETPLRYGWYLPNFTQKCFGCGKCEKSCRANALKVEDLPKMTNRLKNRNLCLKGIILLFVASLLSACDKQTVYHSFQSLPTEGWLREDTLSFDVKVTDSLTYYKLSLEVRNRSNYPYQNLPLSICYTTADSIPSPTDTIQLILADKEGIWKGDGWGGLYQTAVPAGSVRIGKPGTYLFKVAYTLPDERLQGINDIGIKLKR